MLIFICTIHFLAQVDILPSKEFTKEVQTAAITATVRLVNRTEKQEGSGIILGRKGKYAYFLTAGHLVNKDDRLDISVFDAKEYPKAKKVYRKIEVVARSNDLVDLALVRVQTADAMPGVLALCPGKQAPAKKSFSALSAGCDDGEAPTCLLDEVLGKKRIRRKGTDGIASFWEVNRKHQTGRSGGPLVDREGRLIGLCSGTSKEKSYFTHLDEIRAFLKRHGW